MQRCRVQWVDVVGGVVGGVGVAVAVGGASEVAVGVPLLVKADGSGAGEVAVGILGDKSTLLELLLRFSENDSRGAERDAN
jgi:hypothetical protein